MKSKFWCTCALGSALSLALAASAHAQTGTILAANPNIEGDGTLGPAAAAAMDRGRLLMNEEDAVTKKAATSSSGEHERSAPASAPSAEAGGVSPLAAIVGGHSFAGQNARNSSPSDSTGAIGPSSYIQMINTSARIYNRNTQSIIATATLNQMAGNAATVNSFHPQIMWDPTTNRFYYVMDSVFASNNNKLAFGFSRTANPTDFSTNHWCKYTYTPANPSRFPDYPKLGDSHFFVIIGVNSFAPSFVGSDLIAIRKPPAGTACPAASTVKVGTRLDLRDTSNLRTFTPVPSNQVDTNATGFVVARNGSLPSDKLWFYNVTRNSSTGLPIFGNARGLTVSGYTVPPDASQPTFTQRLDTLDARPTQAVQALNPDRGVQSFWVQHTVNNPSVNLAAVQWYEINPAPATPVLLRTGLISNETSHFYNAAISPDRRRDGAALQFGDSFVIHYNVSGSASGISPRIVAGSSFSGVALGGFVIVRDAVGPFRDFTCPAADSTCRWGEYSQASPDPRPIFALGRGQVWGTNMYSGVAAPSTAASNFRTWIFDLRP